MNTGIWNRYDVTDLIIDSDGDIQKALLWYAKVFTTMSSEPYHFLAKDFRPKDKEEELLVMI